MEPRVPFHERRRGFFLRTIVPLFWVILGLSLIGGFVNFFFIDRTSNIAVACLFGLAAWMLVIPWILGLRGIKFPPSV